MSDREKERLSRDIEVIGLGLITYVVVVLLRWLDAPSAGFWMIGGLYGVSVIGVITRPWSDSDE